jgi:hypothetical protein
MSWDIFVQDIPPGVEAVDQMPDDFRPGTIGTRDAIIAGILRVVPDADFSDPAWGTIDGPTYSIEVNIGSGDSVTSFALHVRGGDNAAYVVHDILMELGLRAFDPSSPSGIFALDTGSLDGLRRWRTYRDEQLRGGST